MVEEHDWHASGARGNCRSSCRLQPVVLGRRSVPPAWRSHCRSGRQQQYRGVSDHPKWPLGLPSLRPARWSLTPPLRGCWRQVLALTVGWKPRRNPRETCERTQWISRLLFHTGPGSWIAMADAARGAATNRGGWRTSGALSCQSKLVVVEPVSACAPRASLSTPTTCEPRSRTTSAAFCAAHEPT